MKFLNPAVYCFALGHFSVDWAQGAIPALLPYFIEHYGFTYKAAGLLVFGIVLLSSILQPIFGYYADKVSKPWFVSVGDPFFAVFPSASWDLEKHTQPSLPQPSFAVSAVLSIIRKAPSW